MKLGKDQHPESTAFPDSPAAIAHTFAMWMRAADKQRPGAWRDIATWQDVASRCRAFGESIFKEQRVTVRLSGADKRVRKAAQAADDRLRQQTRVAWDYIGGVLRGIRKQPPDEQRATLAALFENYGCVPVAAHGYPHLARAPGGPFCR